MLQGKHNEAFGIALKLLPVVFLGGAIFHRMAALEQRLETIAQTQIAAHAIEVSRAEKMGELSATVVSILDELKRNRVVAQR